MTSHRTEQVASLLHRSVQQVLARGLHDPRIRGLVSVTRVVVAPDMSEAYISVSVLPEKHTELTLHGLQHAAPHIQQRVNRGMTMRRVPRLTFRADASLKKQAAINAAINAARREDQESAINTGCDSTAAVRSADWLEESES